MMNDNDVKKIENFPYLPRTVHITVHVFSDNR